MIRVLDTTAFSAAMRAEPDLIAILAEGRPGDFAVVPPVVAEIEYGICRLPAGRRRELLELQRDRYLGQVRLLDWDSESSHRFGTIKAHLEKAGSLIDDFDIAVAAIALAHDAQVLTANVVHFNRVPDLVAKHWNDGPQ